MQKINRIFILAVFMALLIYTRFVNLSWGLPFPMHPDERNMAVAIQNLKCDSSDCFNPYFFAYGQFPLYLGYILVQDYHFFTGKIGQPISFEEAILSLRVISAIASILNVLILLKIINLIIPKRTSTFLVFIFSPFFIQFSHFGTTESLLMLLYSLIIYKSLQILLSKEMPVKKELILLALISGISVATKISTAFFLIMPVLILLYKDKKSIFKIFQFLVLTLLVSIFFSPHNFISFNDFIGSMKYESDVALGIYRAFYTRQFEYTIPVLFQFTKVFPYALGLPALIMFLLGFFLLPFNKTINFLRLSFIFYFIFNAFFYAKWTRFMAPILPLMLIFTVLFLELINKSRFLNYLTTFIITILIIVPGLAYLSVYQNNDVRFTASDWIYKNIPDKSLVLSETANVVDMPVLPQSQINNEISKNFKYISFNFYDLDENKNLQNQLDDYLTKADYIFVPSRRIFANNTCFESNNSFADFTNKCNFLQSKYPLLTDYYKKLFSERLGFKKVAEFNSFPNIKLQIFGFRFQVDFPDEQAEETWTVFDHPVVRIYKRI